MESLRQRLAVAVKSIQWSYAIFWSISSTEPGVLTWCDGNYNGDIKTRKTIQPEEMEDEDKDDDEVGLQRTEQLRQLYESLSAAAETHHCETQPRRPSAALSTEDLTDSEWYFLVCMTFEFSNGQGLPGRTLAKNTTSWLCDAHIADSKVFSRSLLAKSASIQTVVCFPYLEGVLEFGINEKVLEEQNIVKQIKTLIFDTNVPEIPLESCSGLLDHHIGDDNIIECDQYQQQSWKLVDYEEGEVSFHHHTSMGSSDCTSQNLASDHGDHWSDDDSRYQLILSKIFKNTKRPILGPNYRKCDFNESAFISWRNNDGMEWKASSSQVLLKNVLYEVPKMHENYSVRLGVDNRNPGWMQKLEADNIDHKLSVLSSLVPSRGKVDKESLLDDTINYLKSLERKVEALQSNKKSDDVRERTCDNYANKRKASCDLEDSQDKCSSDCITVSAIEKDVTIEIRCRWRDNLMVEVFDAMRSLNLEYHSVHSSTVNGILTLNIESKLITCTASTAKMIKQSLQRIIGRY